MNKEYGGLILVRGYLDDNDSDNNGIMIRVLE